MSATITLNPDEIKQISLPRTISSSQLRVLARRSEALAIAVEKQWEDFSPQERSLLEAIIYTLIAERRGIIGLLSSLSARLSLAWILIKGEIDALIDYLNALQRLRNAVLTAIEKEHPEYEQKVTEALQEAFSEFDNSSAMTPEDFREWLTNISD
ncbi:hypothetical protein [Iningainema tapete]|uniref:Uncharacterized protein n=1 Tax=Iningainema tapete BLCC-T55 TaxID=2748662 RepID=A0A8J7BXE7_9CYAN|nr:hypothetical protein [Iningainema tapete]MBD2773672.1 hypothetical protein [Iningainema tapete BLCC-T55]